MKIDNFKYEKKLQEVNEKIRELNEVIKARISDWRWFEENKEEFMWEYLCSRCDSGFKQGWECLKEFRDCDRYIRHLQSFSEVEELKGLEEVEL